MCFEKNLWKFKQILKILKVFKIVLSFKENVNKNFEKLKENYNFLLLSILIAGWGLGCSSSFANFPEFGGGGSFPLSPLATPLVWANKLKITITKTLAANNFRELWRILYSVLYCTKVDYCTSIKIEKKW